MMLGMKFIDVVVRFAVTPAGAAFDRHVVRLTGHSLVSWVFARASGVDYNAPLLLTTTPWEPVVDVTRDGSRFLMMRRVLEPSDDEEYRLVIVENFVEELRARVPN